MSEHCNGNCSGCSSAANCAEAKPSRLNAIKHKVLVLSGKGGVGKSTVAASLAFELAREGKKTAILDVDFHGPSQPTLFGIARQRIHGNENGAVPYEIAGVKIVSLGLLLDDADSALIWRGPAKIGVLNQLFEEVDWGDDLDVLVLDFPPGTGDEALSACQTIPGDKTAIVVTTPQEVSLADCRKCLDFCEKLNVRVLGIVENMSSYVCPNCSAKHALFSSGGGRKLADSKGLELLAQVPLDPVFLAACDEGRLPQGLLASEAVSSEMRKVAQAVLVHDAEQEKS